MFGKCFASMYDGSMMGKGAEVFAVWNYIIANAEAEGFLEINPKIAGFKIGMTTEAVERVINGFLQPDPNSRSKVQEGRKLEKHGEYLYRMVNHKYYHDLRSYENRREQNRQAQAVWRAGKSDKPLTAIQQAALDAKQERARIREIKKRTKAAERAGIIAGASQVIAEAFPVPPVQ